MMNNMERFHHDLRERRAVKVIAGINNFDMDRVRQVVTAAHQGNASAVDVAASEEIIRMAKETTNLPVFVSSIDAQELAMAANAGADALEIGNFDALYAEGMRISAEEVLELTRRTRALVGNDIFLSVTIPGHLDINEQIWLARELENFNVNLIQTEGSAVANVEHTGARGLLEKANVSIANTIEISRNTEIHVMTASGINTTTARMAFAAGAHAIGVGSCVNRLNTVVEMTAVVKTIVESVNGMRFVESREMELA